MSIDCRTIKRDVRFTSHGFMLNESVIVVSRIPEESRQQNNLLVCFDGAIRMKSPRLNMSICHVELPK